MRWLLLAVSLVAGAGCPGFEAPVDGPVVRAFQPGGLYAGHWGVDLGVPEGTLVRSAGAGEVTFAGTVAGMQTVTVHHGAGIRTSYSHLSEILVGPGRRVGAGFPLGRSGMDGGRPALHFSLRSGDRYRDPQPLLECRPGKMVLPEVRLVSLREPQQQPGLSWRRATGNPGRNLRSASPGPSGGG